VTEEAIEQGALATETEQDVEEEIADEEEEDYNILIPSKSSHLDFGESTISEADMPMMIQVGYFGEAKKKLIRFAGEETAQTLKNDEVVVFKSFFRAGLRFPLNKMIGEVLDNYEIYLHQLTPNAIVRLNVFIWPYEAKEWTRMLKLSAECMSFITKRRPEKTDCIKILAIITLHIARI
jgi:hypothetical protein